MITSGWGFPNGLSNTCYIKGIYNYRCSRGRPKRRRLIWDSEWFLLPRGPALTRSGTNCFPIAPVAPAKNTLMVHLLWS
jgi:hypothetical protein